MVTLGTLYIYRGIDSVIAGSNQVTAQSLSGRIGRPRVLVAVRDPWPGGITPSSSRYRPRVHPPHLLRPIDSRHRQQPAAAEKIGIPAKRLIFARLRRLWVCSADSPGVLWGARYGTIDSSVASGYEIVVLAAVVVGGVSVNGGSGSIAGVVLGAAILSVIATGLALVNVSQFWLQAIQGPSSWPRSSQIPSSALRVEARGARHEHVDDRRLRLRHRPKYRSGGAKRAPAWWFGAWERVAAGPGRGWH